LFGYYDRSKHEAMTEAGKQACSTHALNTTIIFAANGYWAGGDGLQPPENAMTFVLEEWQSRNDGRPLCGNQGTDRRYSRPLGAGYESCVQLMAQHPA